MGISFKVSKTGTRFRPKPLQAETAVEEDVVVDTSNGSSRILDNNNESTSSPTRKLEVNITGGDEDAAIPENEVSFTLNLFPDGYSIGKPSENETAHHASLQDIPKFLHPYDRTSETLFSAIESGRLPGDILDDIPCKYVDGTLLCEVRDYRKCTSEAGLAVSSSDASPLVHKVHLRMSLENVVKDIPLISDSTWTYGDLMEVESRILKALQPQLCLDPTPKLDRLCNNPVPTKLNLALCSLRRKRLRQMPEIAVTSTNKIHGKKVCIDRVAENSNCGLGEAGPISGTVMPQHAHENLTAQNVDSLRAKSFVPDASASVLPIVSHQSKYHMGVGNPRMTQDHGSEPVSTVPGISPSGQDIMMSYTSNLNSNVSSVHGKRESQDGMLSPVSSLNKRTRLTSVGPDGYQQQPMVQHMESFHGSDSHWKNTLLHQPSIARGIQYANTGMQKFEGGLNQEGGATQFAVAQQQAMRDAKEEAVETERLDKPELNQNKNEMHMMEAERNHMDLQQSRLQQRLPQHALMRSSFSQTPWNNLGQHLDNNSRKEDQLQKRKSVQSPRVSAGGLPQSPLSSKSGEFSSGSIGPQFGPVSTSALGSSQKEKLAVTSVPTAGGTTSLTSSANDSMQRQHQAQLAAKRRSNSLPKTSAMSGVGSPASISNVSVPLNASSPPVGTSSLADQIMLDRFSKIERVAARYQINHKKNKVDEHPIRKPIVFSAQQLLLQLSSESNGENFRDETCTMPLSKSLVGGSMNACKTRVLNFVQAERILQGNAFSIVPRARTRLIMSGKPSDGTIAVLYGDIDDGDFLAAEDYLPTLPNPHIADLLAAQLCSLMKREGYHVEDHIQPKPIRINRASNSQSNAAGTPQNNNAGIEMQQYSDAVSGQTSNDVAQPTNSGNASLMSTQNLPSSRMLPPGSAQALQTFQAHLSGGSMPGRPQHLDTQSSLQPQQSQQPLMQQQPPQFQRSSLMLSANPLSHMNTIGQNTNMPMGNHMVHKHNALQFQLLQQQQQQQQQQQPQMQRKMMMGPGTAVGMGNMGNNIVRLGGLGNVMGMGGPRGMGGTAISAAMGTISGLGNVGQNPMNLSQASNISNVISQKLRSGELMPQAQAIMATQLRMAQNRSNMLGGPQSSMGGISGARQMHPGSAGLSLGHTLNRANINTLPRTAIGPMGPPKLMSGMNLYMNQQQQTQQLQQQQLQLQQQQQMQQQQLQQQQFQQQQQQETNSPLQTVVSTPQVGSPSTLGIPQQLNQQLQQQQQQQQQQQASPQQVNQRTPMSPQLSSGTMHPLSGGNPEACPASPQLSSQTLGSVGSITNSPMELQGVNKSNSVSNA
ncbi:hypothetical protein U1Q18_006830 [Sarracenia purpurea var. burkii]